MIFIAAAQHRHVADGDAGRLKPRHPDVGEEVHESINTSLPTERRTPGSV